MERREIECGMSLEESAERVDWCRTDLAPRLGVACLSVEAFISYVPRSYTKNGLTRRDEGNAAVAEATIPITPKYRRGATPGPQLDLRNVGPKRVEFFLSNVAPNV